MGRRLLLLVLLIVSGVAHAQKFPFEFWHDGKAVLESGDTLRGLIKYSLQDDLIQMQVSNRLDTYSSRKVLFFEIFDTSVKRYRPFYSMPYATTGVYKAPTFFELLEEGKITLLTRETLETRTYSSYYYPGSTTRLVLVNKYFLLNPNGTISEFTGKKSDLVDLMGTKENQVTKYIKENKLDFDNKYDVARLVGYYNSLFQ